MATIYQQPPANVVYMAPQQPQQQGTLLPGQSISLKQYTVTVERYLSQGGFAHVYLVRSPQPINGTTSHVLKRIAVSDDVMLKEVQKEVDVMKVLRGHPNIVNLIDSASFKHSNGTYEVFILMEFCAGGGIIDMMNRRLRERLTEQEILQIFVDVCEGVASMHNLRPALLHRDLKVENILQASDKLYKLCDFGSAATAALKPPSTTAEIRALEQDVLRHTTLQYRAPEMVDPYLRLPIDEKSDVWALGVLLYKLCFYTTPFEEHGPLAIVNVHYKIPSYPVYSQNMINLIGSMLQKYGTARPSVFELLETVHRLRGTRSPYSYRHRRALNLDIPMPRPVSKRLQAAQPPSVPATPLTTPAMSPNHTPPSRKGSQPMYAPVQHHPPPPPPLDNMYFPPSNPCVVVVQQPLQSRPGDPSQSRKGTYVVQQGPPQYPGMPKHPIPPPIRSYTYMMPPAGSDSNANTPTSMYSRSSSQTRTDSRQPSPPRGADGKRQPTVLRKEPARPPMPVRSMTQPMVVFGPPTVPRMPPQMPPVPPMVSPAPVGGSRRFWGRGN